MLDPADWTSFSLASGSDGVIPGPGGFVTIDSIMFYGAPTTGNATMWFDFVGVNNAGSLDVMTGVPEPTALIVLAPAITLSRSAPPTLTVHRRSVALRVSHQVW